MGNIRKILQGCPHINQSECYGLHQSQWDKIWQISEDTFFYSNKTIMHEVNEFH